MFRRKIKLAIRYKSGHTVKIKVTNAKVTSDFDEGIQSYSFDDLAPTALYINPTAIESIWRVR